LGRQDDREPCARRKSRGAHRYGGPARHPREHGPAGDPGAAPARPEEVAGRGALQVDSNRSHRGEAPALRLQADRVRTAFGPTVGVEGVTLSAAAGSVHAVIGENGAGKSTLMNILAGAISPDAGAVLLDGNPYRPRNPEAARRAGVAMVHQELSLCPHLSVAE